MSNDTDFGGFYILQKEDEPNLIKIGMTSKKNTDLRTIGYPRKEGWISKIGFQIKDHKLFETAAKKLLKQWFIPRRDWGYEYFQGDYNQIEKLIYELKNQFLNLT
jgi:hypothetical protein